MTSPPTRRVRPTGLLGLVGPTASGKTEASVAVARVLAAEIVCVDSMLVYRGMDVGTAKPGGREREMVPHHLLDLVDPVEPFSVARFQELAHRAVDEIGRRGLPALLVGGSGLYYRAVVDGLAFPGTAPGTRSLLEAEAIALGPHLLHGRLASFDPRAASRIEPANARRSVRALEVAAITGRRFSSFARDWDRYPRGAVRAAGVAIPRPILHRRIDQRVERTMPGLVGETEGLLERGFGAFLTSSQAIGYAEAAAVLDGRLSTEEAAARTARRTKALARRQMAWFRRDPRIRWFEGGEEGAAGIIEALIGYLGSERAGRAAAQATREA